MCGLGVLCVFKVGLGVEYSCAGRCLCVFDVCVWPRSMNMRYGWVKVSDDGPYTHPVVAPCPLWVIITRADAAPIAGVRVGA